MRIFTGALLWKSNLFSGPLRKISFLPRTFKKNCVFSMDFREKSRLFRSPLIKFLFFWDHLTKFTSFLEAFDEICTFSRVPGMKFAFFAILRQNSRFFHENYDFSLSFGEIHTFSHDPLMKLASFTSHFDRKFFWSSLKNFSFFSAVLWQNSQLSENI